MEAAPCFSGNLVTSSQSQYQNFVLLPDGKLYWSGMYVNLSLFYALIACYACCVGFVLTSWFIIFLLVRPLMATT